MSKIGNPEILIKVKVEASTRLNQEFCSTKKVEESGGNLLGNQIFHNKSPNFQVLDSKLMDHFLLKLYPNNDKYIQKTFSLNHNLILFLTIQIDVDKEQLELKISTKPASRACSILSGNFFENRKKN